MQKIYAEFFTGQGMSINGNTAYGVIRGYETNALVRILDNVAPLTLHFSCHTTAEQKGAIEHAFRVAAFKFFRYSFTPFGLSIGLNDITGIRLMKRMPDLLDQFIRILNESGAQDSRYCPFCGNELNPETAEKSLVDGFTFTLDEECVASLNKTITAENQDFEAAPNNYLNGFAGALLGGLIGAAIAVILYVVGFVSSISAFVAVLLGVFFYKKLHGKPNMVMVAIVALTTLGCMAGAVLGIYVTVAAMAAADAGASLSAMEAFRICMADADFSRYFYSDLGLFMLFSVVGIGYQVFSLAKSVKRRKEI